MLEFEPSPILTDMPPQALANSQLWSWLAIALAAGFLVWLLAPILTPFLFAAILAYTFDPVVERLAPPRGPRTLAGGPGLPLPRGLLVKGARMLAERAPGFVEWFNRGAAPWLASRLGIELLLDAGTAKQLARALFTENADLAHALPASLKGGGGG